MEIAAGIGEGEISYLTAERRGAEERGLSIYWGRPGWKNVEEDGLLYILPCDPSQSHEPLQMWIERRVRGGSE